MTRQRLPDRRPSATISTTFKTHPLKITIGYDPATGAAREIFASGPKEGTDMEHALSDACVVISIALQHGITPAEMSKSLGVVPGFNGDEPASLIGVIVGVLSEQ